MSVSVNEQYDDVALWTAQPVISERFDDWAARNVLRCTGDDASVAILTLGGGHRATSFAVVLLAVFVVLLVPTGHQIHTGAPIVQVANSASTVGSGAVHTYTLYLPHVASWYDDAVPNFGIQFYDLSGTLLDRYSEAGMRWVRVPIWWSRIEPVDTTPEHYDWSYFDAQVAAVAARDMRMIVSLASQPDWAAAYSMGPVTDTATIKEFVGAFVERYDGDGFQDAPGSPEILHFELYNEPDNSSRIAAARATAGYWGHNGVGYAALMRELYPVIKAANPTTHLVFGGIALDYFEPYGPFAPDFLDTVLAACQGHDCFDVMNFHYYPFYRRGWEDYGADIIGKATYVRQRLEAHGFADTPVIVTEFNWSSGGPWGSDEMQSRYAVTGYVRAAAADLMAAVWYMHYDGVDGNLPALLDVNKQPKPGYWAFANMATMLTGARYERPLTAAETGSSQLVGYRFMRRGLPIDVVWTEDSTPYDTDDDPVLLYAVGIQSLRVVDKFGNVQWLHDGDDGEVDGHVTVTVGGSPLFLELYP